MRLPSIPVPQVTQQVIREFRGYNRVLEIAEGEWSDEQNLTADEFPVFSTRKMRGMGKALTNPGGIITKDAMAVVENRHLYFNGNLVNGLELTDGVKQLISMGAYLLIWPDKKYFNTEDAGDYGSMENKRTATGVAVTLCRPDGTDYQFTTGASAPEKAEDGSLWLDTSGATPEMKRWTESSAMWVSVAAVHVRLSAANIGLGFKQYDGVTISGFTGDLAALNGSHVLQAVEDGAITIVGIVDTKNDVKEETVTISRTVPNMDFVTECGNRIWGCKYGFVNGRTVNEIYASKLGDFKNWNCFEGLSTDSYVASRGSDGVFTGAVTHLGHPLFFKEDCIEKVYPAANGAHQIVTTEGRGVQKGSWRSLQVVDETLYYKSRKDICAYTGALPVSVSDALGDTEYSDARAGAIGKKYYISMKDKLGAWHLFVYDTAKGIWHREDSTQAMMFTVTDGHLWWIDGKKSVLVCADGGAQGCISEESKYDLVWSAESGVIGLREVEQKYLARFVIRAEMLGDELTVSLQYDDGPWEQKGFTGRMGMHSFTVPVATHRFDHVKLRLEGRGPCRIYSISKLMEKGSDRTW